MANEGRSAPGNTTVRATKGTSGGRAPSTNPDDVAANNTSAGSGRSTTPNKASASGMVNQISQLTGLSPIVVTSIMGVSTLISVFLVYKMIKRKK